MASAITLTQGLLSLPGATFKTKALVKQLLDKDRETHHCFWGKPGFHNHLSHHILAAYDFGAPAPVLQAIYDEEAKTLSPINLVDRKEGRVAPPDTTITASNWTEYVGKERYYVSYLAFFKAEVERLGPSSCLKEYVFSSRANGNETSMLLRFAGGAVHPLILTGYGVEFNEPTLVASGLAQTAVSSPLYPGIYEDSPPAAVHTNGISHASGVSDKPDTKRQPSSGPSLLAIIRMMYDSDVLTPVMPYNPDTFLSTRLKEAMTNGRPEEIKRLSSLWNVDVSLGAREIDSRIEEIIWVCTLLTVATGKHGRKPRVDFFLMHLLTSALFLPTLLKAINDPNDKARILRVHVSEILMIILLRGRPRIDCSLVMTYTEYPQAPGAATQPAPDASSLGNPTIADNTNPWAGIIAAVIHAPDAHTVKSIRTLYYAAQKFGDTPPGGAIGAFNADGSEALKDSGKLDGTIFIRGAGVIMDALGWVSHGQKEGHWDRSALGWDGAWDNED